jgi:hypothetical protein
MLLKVVFDKTPFVKFKISNNIEQKIDETHEKQQKLHRKIHTSLWILKIQRKNRKPKVLRLLPNFCVFQKKTIPQGPVENLWPILWIFILCDFHL